MGKEKPVHQIALGKVRAAVWLNTSEDGKRYFRTTIVRRYRKDEEWLDSSSFSPEELPAVAQAAQMACTWACDHSRALYEEDAGEL